MDTKSLESIAKNLACQNKGILAADESTKTAGKRLVSIGLESTEENRRQYRELFFTTPGIGKYLSGVILYDETTRQNASNGKPFLQLLQEQGVIPGIKVDGGLVDFSGSSDEQITQGLEGLEARLLEYYKIGARFSKWRSVVTIDEAKHLPTLECICENARIMTNYAKMSQRAGIVPIVEPEVLLEGSHSSAKAEEVTTRTLQEVFRQLQEQGVHLPGLILKTSMVVPGKESGEAMVPEKVGEMTIRCLKASVPASVAGVVFLSGGQTAQQATANLNAIAKLEKQAGGMLWGISFSYARALQGPSLEVWKGKSENIPVAQQVFLKRLEFTVAADRGEYDSFLEE